MTALDLFNTLEDLKEEEFKKFKWCLQQDILDGYQSIKVSKLENAERQDTVDVMVKTYKHQGALKVSKKVLEEINRNDLVQRLPDTISGPQVMAAASNVPSEEVSKPGEVPSDVSTGTKLKARKSFLVSLVSCFGTQQINPVETLEGRMSELKRVQQYAVDVTLDPDTAHPKLILSDDGKEVNESDVRKNLPDNPKRFSLYCIVLGKQSFSSGRFYFEVKVKGKSNWDLGVARESIDRKGRITTSPRYGNWTLLLRNRNEYIAAADPQVRLSLKYSPKKVGVFVDYEEGLVSFYDVDAAALIYSFTGCSFTENLFPYFCPCNNDRGKNSAPLIISPVRVN
ncbi:E3 ubiquitin-protein ligase TRIM21-like [Perca fluviatilis]|uniref:E3 ubiquitin-protein ligase TRIM21-like n=1 Tax=Perca fluviatilis TaxID=8168 RepID=UPI001965133B|nr:E3 ubiquitin-protein ligase TRIM21-like [Perca fluviatilis]XP_039669332.1 E3 ubiquitin-protein ligase TRIM21-like [Perca fluviatilis]